MVTIFCLRLALGMTGSMLVLPADVVPPRFFRVQFLTALGLAVLAGLFLPTSKGGPRGAIVGAGLICFVGGVVWHTDRAPLGRTLMWLAATLFAGALFLARPDFGERDPFWPRIDDFASALVLGAVISAMLMGHSYLIAPTMSLTPLNRLLGLLAGALAVRIALAVLGLAWWTRLSQAVTPDRETILWLVGRWGLGLVLPVGLTWMAWESARIRSTQSATGILYVATVLVFLGELLGLLLVEKVGFSM